MNIEKVIREYLSTVVHLSLATSKESKPWICEVHFVFDKDLNFYFRSRTNTRHSQEIASNTNVAGNIVRQHTAEEEVRGVYFEGTTELLDGVDEQHPAYQLYCKRFNTGPDILEEARTMKGHKFYQIHVKNFYVFDSQESHPSTKYHLPWPVK